MGVFVYYCSDQFSEALFSPFCVMKLVLKEAVASQKEGVIEAASDPAED